MAILPPVFGLLQWGEEYPAAARSDSDKRGCMGQRACRSPVLQERSGMRRRGVIPVSGVASGRQSRCSCSPTERAAISSINFLQFSEREWEELAGNRYMFHNRLWLDEFQNLLTDLKLEIVALDSRVDDEAIDVLKSRFPLNER